MQEVTKDNKRHQIPFVPRENTYTDRPSQVNKIFIFSERLLFKIGKEIGIKDIAYVASRVFKKHKLRTPIISFPDLLWTKPKARSGKVRKFVFLDWLLHLTPVQSPL